jgi:hypothetical protein
MEEVGMKLTAKRPYTYKRQGARTPATGFTGDSLERKKDDGLPRLDMPGWSGPWTQRHSGHQVFLTEHELGDGKTFDMEGI